MNIVQQAARRLERLAALDKVATPLAAAPGRAVRPRVVRNLLSGTDLGHPLPPMLTDLPIRAWVMSALPDAAGSPAAEAPADLLVTAPIARQHLPVRRRQHHAQPGQHARAQLPDAHPERAYRGPRLHIGVADLSHRRGSSQKTPFCAPRTDPTEEAVPLQNGGSRSR
jgi:hypothetical protein